MRIMAWVCKCECINGQVEQCRKCGGERDDGREVLGVKNGKPITRLQKSENDIEWMRNNDPDFIEAKQF